jgi:hypothetical protein
MAGKKVTVRNRRGQEKVVSLGVATILVAKKWATIVPDPEPEPPPAPPKAVRRKIVEPEVMTVADAAEEVTPRRRRYRRTDLQAED